MEKNKKLNLSNIIEYLLAFLLVISCNSMVLRSTLISKSGYISENYIFIGIFVLAFIYMIINSRVKIKVTTIVVFVIFCVFFSIIQIFIASLSIAIESFFRFSLVFCSLLLIKLILVSKGEADNLLYKFVDIVVMLAVISLLCWIFGSFLSLIPYDYVYTDWSSGVTGHFLPVKTYFGLMYESQGSYTVFGVSVIRNCGIFTEAPMYGFVLVLALILNEFYLEKRNNRYTNILLLTILSTTSYTAIACGIITISMKLIAELPSIKSKFIRALVVIVVPIVFIMCIYMVGVLYQNKISTNEISASARFRDIKICLQTFCDTIFGCGFYNQGFYTRGLSGFSTGFFRLLGETGVLLGWMPIFFAIKLFKNTKYKFRSLCFIGCFFIVYVFTNLPYTPVILLLFSTIFVNSEEKNE